jgi:glycosyltransferase involved in cell wall biosynthesis
MNLLLINYEYPPIGGGAATATWNMSHELVQQGHHVIILTAAYKELQGWHKEKGVQIYRCWALRQLKDRSTLLEQLSFVISATFVLNKVIINYDIEGIIVFFSMPCGPLGLWGKVLKRIPYIISLRGGDVPGVEKRVIWLHRLLKPIRQLILKHSQTIVANSFSLKKIAQQTDPFPISIIPNGVDSNFFYPISHQNPIFQFLFVGRFQSQKNLFFLLNQLSLLKNKQNIPFQCGLVGDGHLKAALQKYALELNLASTLVWHGWQLKEQLRHLYQQSDCLLNLSLYEGMSNVILEAMACGLPIIASQVIGNDAVVQHGKTGYLVDLENQDDCQKALQSLLTDQEKAQQFGQAGRNWVETDFSWAKVANEYVQLFRKQNYAI